MQLIDVAKLFKNILRIYLNMKDSALLRWLKSTFFYNSQEFKSHNTTILKTYKTNKNFK